MKPDTEGISLGYIWNNNYTCLVSLLNNVLHKLDLSFHAVSTQHINRTPFNPSRVISFWWSRRARWWLSLLISWTAISSKFNNIFLQNRARSLAKTHGILTKVYRNKNLLKQSTRIFSLCLFQLSRPSRDKHVTIHYCDRFWSKDGWWIFMRTLILDARWLGASRTVVSGSA